MGTTNQFEALRARLEEQLRADVELLHEGPPGEVAGV